MHVMANRKFELAFGVLEGLGNFGDLSKFLGGPQFEQLDTILKQTEDAWRDIENSDAISNFFIPPKINRCISGGYLGHIFDTKNPSFFDFSPYLHWKFRIESTLFGGFYVVRGKIPYVAGGGYRGFLALVGSAAGLTELVGKVRDFYRAEKINGGFYMDLINCLEGLERK